MQRGNDEHRDRGKVPGQKGQPVRGWHLQNRLREFKVTQERGEK